MLVISKVNPWHCNNIPLITLFEWKKNFQASLERWKENRSFRTIEHRNPTDQLEKKEKATCFPRPTHSLSSGLKIPEISDIWYLKDTWEHTVLVKYNGCGSLPKIGLRKWLKRDQGLDYFFKSKGNIYFRLGWKVFKSQVRNKSKTSCCNGVVMEH